MLKCNGFIFFSPWQTALKLLVGHNEELLLAIPILLGCNKEGRVEGNFIEMAVVRGVVNLMKETAFSRLMEVSDPLTVKGGAYVRLIYYLLVFAWFTLRLHASVVLLKSNQLSITP